MRKQDFSKLMYYLSALDKGDRAQFRDYLLSPIFNQKEEPRRLFDHILHHCLRDAPVELDDEIALQAVWPEGNGDPARLQKLKSALMNLYFSFLEFQHWQASPALSKAGLLHRLHDLHDESYFDLYYRKVKAELNQWPQQDWDLFTAELKLEKAMMRHQSAYGQRTHENHLDIATRAMQKVVQGHVLKFAYLYANQQQIVGANTPDWIQAYMAQLPYADVEGEPLLEVYFLLNATLKPDTDLAQLNLLKEKLLAHTDRWSMEVAENIFTGTINNFTRFSQRTGQNLLAPIFELFQSKVETLHRKGGARMDPSTLKNIVFVGARMGEFEWVRILLAEVAEWLEDDAPETTLAYNQGILHFYQKDFAQAKRHFNLALADVKDVFYAYDARLHLLMCLYETGDSLGMESLVHSFRMLLGRSGRISESHKKKYLEWVRLFRKMLGIPLHDQFRLQQLRAEIDLLAASAGKNWLLDKVDSLLA